MAGYTWSGGITRRPEFSLPAEAKHNGQHNGWPSPAESTSNRAGLCKPNGVVAHQTLGPWQFVVAQHRSSLLDYYDSGFDDGVPNAQKRPAVELSNCGDVGSAGAALANQDRRVVLVGRDRPRCRENALLHFWSVAGYPAAGTS